MKKSVHMRGFSLPQRIRAGCDCSANGIIPTIELCLSAFVRVATLSVSPSVISAIFASAHSCGLRLAWGDGKPETVIFASAHSCGLRLCAPVTAAVTPLFASAHSCGLRRANDFKKATLWPLPQRIRAGCDALRDAFKLKRDLCLSAFVRVATRLSYLPS